MSAVVSRERARMAGLTGVAGLLVVALAVVMMIAAAPRPHPQASAQAAVRTDAVAAAVCASQYASRSAAASGDTAPLVPAVGAGARRGVQRGARSTLTERGPTLTLSPAARGDAAETEAGS